MPKVQQLDNPGGAFGYTVHGGQALQGQVTRKFYNASTLSIPVGSPVVLSTVSSQGSAVRAPTTGTTNLLAIGVALTSAPAASTALETTAAPSSIWFDVVTEGPAVVQVATAAGKGQPLVASATANELTSAAVTGAGFVSIYGRLLLAGTTGTTGFLATAANRGIAWIDPQIVIRTSVAG